MVTQSKYLNVNIPKREGYQGDPLAYKYKAYGTIKGVEPLVIEVLERFNSENSF